MRDALLIKLMDSAGRSLLRTPRFPSFSSLSALCSLPLTQSIHSRSKHLLLTSQEKSITRGRGETLEGGGRGIKGSRISGERERRFCSFTQWGTNEIEGSRPSWKIEMVPFAKRVCSERPSHN